MTHQFGHVLGIGHSNNEKSVMYPFYIYKKEFSLYIDDISEIQKLYGYITQYNSY